jgi:hypothetical protein
MFSRPHLNGMAAVLSVRCVSCPVVARSARTLAPMLPDSRWLMSALKSANQDDCVTCRRGHCGRHAQQGVHSEL